MLKPHLFIILLVNFVRALKINDKEKIACLSKALKFMEVSLLAATDVAEGKCEITEQDSLETVFLPYLTQFSKSTVDQILDHSNIAFAATICLLELQKLDEDTETKSHSRWN